MEYLPSFDMKDSKECILRKIIKKTYKGVYSTFQQFLGRNYLSLTHIENEEYQESKEFLKT